MSHLPGDMVHVTFSALPVYCWESPSLRFSSDRQSHRYGPNIQFLVTISQGVLGGMGVWL
jgi:hypothetical protein